MRRFSKSLCIILSLLLVITSLSSCYILKESFNFGADATTDSGTESSENDNKNETAPPADDNTDSNEGDSGNETPPPSGEVPDPDEDDNTDITVEKNKKVLLVSIDGMRADAVLASKYANKLKQMSTYSTNATTVYPSVTLPCHMSMQHGVSPSSHGVTTNTYTPSSKLVDGIAETLSQSGKTCAYFYNWGPLGDVIADNALVKEKYISGDTYGWKQSNEALAASCKEYLINNDVDYTFLYLGCLDDVGHNYGWLSNQYNAELDASLELVFDIMEVLSEEYTVIITADHGGHNKTHGSNSQEDMTIPIFIIGNDFEENKAISNASILDIAPTVVSILGVAPQASWEGEVLK